MEYLLINSDGDYKCRNREFGKNGVYELLTGKSLKDETVSVNEKALLEAERIEKESVKLCKDLFLKTTN